MLYQMRTLVFLATVVLASSCANLARQDQVGNNSQAISDSSADVQTLASLQEDASADVLPEVVIISEILVKKVKKKDLLDRLRKELRWNLLYSHNKRVQRELSLFKDNQKFVDETFRGAKKYLYYVAEQIDKHNMPIELAFLPGIESQYKPLAYSFAHAAGLWQIIPSTAENLGLELNWWHDQRRDLVASTDAAINYLLLLNKRFKGDWLLTLAAYNAGPLRVEKAIRKNKLAGKKTDYWSLRLPRETKRYVPKLIALIELISDPKRYGVKIPAIADEQVFTSIKLKQQLDMHRLAIQTGYPLAELIAFNGGLNQRFTEPFGEYYLHVPMYMKNKVLNYLDDNAPKIDEYWISYKVTNSKKLAEIAKKFDTSQSRLATVNRLGKSMNLRKKQYLLVPIDSEKIDHYRHYHDNKPDKILVRKGDSQRYRLKRGDSLWKLSRVFKVSINDLMRWNNINKNTKLYAGKSIYIKRTSYLREEPIRLQPSLEHNLLTKVYYPVRSGDTLTSIANRFGVSKKGIISWNPELAKGVLRAKKTIILYVDVTRTY